MDNLDGFDPGDWIIPRVERVHGLPRRYECDRLSDTDGTVVASPRAATSIIPNSTTLYFDYEFSLPHPGEPMDEVIMQDLPILEFGILRRLAIVSGLSECDLRKQLDDPALNPLLFDSNLVVGLSSAQPDKKTALGRCRYLSSSPERNTLCVPIHGEMTAYYLGDERRVIDYLLYHLSIEMNSQRTLVGSIDQVYYIGTASGQSSSIQQTTPTSTGRDAGEYDTKSLALSIPFVLAAIVIVLVYLVQRRRKSNEREINHFPPPVDDIEASISSSMKPCGESGSIEQQQCTGSSPPDLGAEYPPHYMPSVDIPPDALSMTPETPDLLLMDLDVKDGTSSQVDLTNDMSSESTSTYSTNTTVDPFLPPPQTMMDSLPPLPPGGPSAKTAAAKPVVTTLKKRRRPKKKKKASLVRVNSRELANEMETIAEGDNEKGSDDGVEDCESGSEYSWSTDGTDSRPNSRESSPARCPRNDESLSPLRSRNIGENELSSQRDTGRFVII